MRGGALLAVLLAGIASALTRAPLPDNACALLGAHDIAQAGQLVVQPGRSVPTRGETVAAERGESVGPPRRICVFETGAEFGAITVSLTPRAERRAATYWEWREHYFRTYVGSARVIPGVGQDAWLAGGVSLSVLIRDDEYFSLSTQQYQPESGELLAKIAKLIVSKHERSGGS